MLKHVARDQKRWMDEGKECVPVSVNVSRAHFIEEDLAEQIRDIVAQVGCPASLIEIELTESAFFDDKKVMLGRVVVLPEYRNKGIGTFVVKEAEKWAKELGFHTAVVESRDNKMPFYEKMGYVADYSKKIVGETFTCFRMEKKL
jgi:GNAT superfamily N-acetyltransferase